MKKVDGRSKAARAAKKAAQESLDAGRKILKAWDEQVQAGGKGYEGVYVPLVTSPGADLHQVGGNHYKRLGIEPWTALGAWLSPEEFTGFLRGNAVRYLARAPLKGGLEDVKKAKHYLEKLIELHEGK